MFRAIFMTQWKWSRLVVLLSTVAAFALPLASLRSASDAFSATDFVRQMQSWATGYALLAAASGLLVALMAWQQDHAGHHVYALSLPVSRARYTAMRFGAGAAFLAAPVVAVLIGCLIVAASHAIPQGLHVYPLELATRFALAAFVSYSIFFAIASSTPQTAGVVIGIIAAVLFTQYLLSVTNTDVDILGPIANFLFVRPGFFSVFAGRWMLVDV